jgi:DNA-binding transcriptional regulator YdaS (Cro superfamily)
MRNRKPKAPAKAPLDRAVEKLGSKTALAIALKISRAAVCQWDRVPSGRVGAVSKLTGIPPHELRPDLFSVPA